jgi:hypothetical protein
VPYFLTDIVPISFIFQGKFAIIRKSFAIKGGKTMAHVFENEIEKLTDVFKETKGTDPYTAFNLTLLKAVVVLDRKIKGETISRAEEKQYYENHLKYQQE